MASPKVARCLDMIRISQLVHDADIKEMRCKQRQRVLLMAQRSGSQPLEYLASVVYHGLCIRTAVTILRATGRGSCIPKVPQLRCRTRHLCAFVLKASLGDIAQQQGSSA